MKRSKDFVNVCVEIYCTLIPKGLFPQTGFAKLTSNGRKERQEMRVVERVTSPTGLCLPPGLVRWSRPTGRSRASCDGILLATVVWKLWGYTIADSTFPPILYPSQGLFLLAKGWCLGGGPLLWGLLRTTTPLLEYVGNQSQQLTRTDIM